MKEKTQYDRLAARLIELTCCTGGATINLKGEEKTTGISCAVDRKYEATAPCLFQAAVASWVRRMVPVLEANPYYCLGAWRDDSDGTFYLDVVDVLPDRQLDMVLRNAKEHKQKAIYHITSKTTLRIE